jgi:thiosulfate/3-mercaptopyruvate sulfurtransferase
MYYVLKYYGHKDIRILNGGVKAWLREGSELVIDVPNFAPLVYSIRGEESTLLLI